MSSCSRKECAGTLLGDIRVSKGAWGLTWAMSGPNKQMPGQADQRVHDSMIGNERLKMKKINNNIQL